MEPDIYLVDVPVGVHVGVPPQRSCPGGLAGPTRSIDDQGLGPFGLGVLDFHPVQHGLRDVNEVGVVGYVLFPR